MFINHMAENPILYLGILIGVVLALIVFMFVVIPLENWVMRRG